jgi:hypothetical protein
MIAPDRMRHHDSHRPERRQARRSAYGASVRIESELALGMDISSLGLSVEMAHSMPIGDLVHVTLSPSSEDGALDEIGALARVVRLERGRHRIRVALQFVGPDA